MFDISKYYDLGKLEFIGDKRHFEDALKDEVIMYCRKDKWYKRYCGAEAKIVRIVLDNEHKPYKKYGKDYKKIINKISGLGNRLSGIKDVTGKYPALIDQINAKIIEVRRAILNNDENLLKDKLKELKGLCSESIHDEDNPYKDILESIKKLINSIGLVMYTTGKYNHSTNTITLYLKNIFYYDNEKDNVDSLLTTLIHETVHLIHYGCLDRFKIKVNKVFRKDDIVLESYASFMEYLYLRNKLGNRNLSNELYKSWENYDMYEYPYSGALYLHGGHNKCSNYINIRHLLEPADRLFSDSLNDMNSAYEDMIMFKVLYEINEGYGRVII